MNEFIPKEKVKEVIEKVIDFLKEQVIKEKPLTNTCMSIDGTIYLVEKIKNKLLENE